MTREYDSWTGRGTPEAPHRCIVEVVDHTGFHWYQCSRLRVVGNLCRQHFKMRRAGKHLKIPADRGATS